jgi:hypothetical protein
MKKIVIAALILVTAGAALCGQNLEGLGYTILSTGTEDGYTVVTARDPAGGLTFDLYYKSLTPRHLSFLQEARKIILSWKYLVPGNLRVIFQPRVVEIRVIPDSFVYEGTDYAANVPSAINFYFKDILEYDFRILVDNITLRVRGPYFNEEQLASKLQSAVANPIAFIQSNDPEYIVRRLGEMSAEIETLNARVEELTADLSKLAEANETLVKKYRQLQLGTIAAANQGLFSLIKDVNKEGIEQAIVLKEQNPSYTEDQLRAACKDKGIPLSAKEIHLVFMVYFNEF